MTSQLLHPQYSLLRRCPSYSASRALVVVRSGKSTHMHWPQMRLVTYQTQQNHHQPPGRFQRLTSFSAREANSCDNFHAKRVVCEVLLLVSERYRAQTWVPSMGCIASCESSALSVCFARWSHSWLTPKRSKPKPQPSSHYMLKTCKPEGRGCQTILKDARCDEPDRCAFIRR